MPVPRCDSGPSNRSRRWYQSRRCGSVRPAGIYAGRLLNGEKPSDLPVQLVTKVELFINLKAAKILGIEFSPSLIGGADEVIE